MNRFLQVTVFCCVLFLTACATHPLTAEEQIAREVRNTCVADANAMIGDEFFNELEWKWYYERCMAQKGYTAEEAQNIRYK